jgi:hypothetical protein
MMQELQRPVIREQAHTDEYLTGYRAPCYQALWKRILRWGGPRVLSYVWCALCLWLGLTCLFAKQPWFILGVGGLWMAVQGVIIALTLWDLQFDAVLVETPKYHVVLYDAG